VCQEFEIEIEEDVIRRIAFGFAGGLGNTGAVCGAVCGAVMAIGLKRGRANNMEEALCELATEEGLEQLMNSDIPQTVCFPAVGAAYRLVVDLLKESS
jgi:C_GCAxxG_C_C family probable redox protein